MVHTALRLIAVCLVATAFAGFDPGSSAFEPTRISSDRASAEYARALSDARTRHFGAQIVHIDPATGERLQSPPPGFVPSPPGIVPRAALFEEALPSGGVKVKLKGNFRMAAHAHIGEDGALHRDCKVQH